MQNAYATVQLTHVMGRFSLAPADGVQVCDVGSQASQPASVSASAGKLTSKEELHPDS